MGYGGQMLTPECISKKLVPNLSEDFIGVFAQPLLVFGLEHVGALRFDKIMELPVVFTKLLCLLSVHTLD